MKKHGLPFIIAVRDNSKASIKEAFVRRIGNHRATEFAKALRQVERIAELRLRDLLPSCAMISLSSQ
ncbi:2-oxo-4-hydroxy-4-carboxy-5-ureidoimidazoline decarboxylase [Sedimentitalea todarodis]